MSDDSSSYSALGKQQGGMDSSVPHSARIWNYWLGGKDHYPIDREIGDQVREQYPGIVEIAQASRQFIIRTVHYLAAEAGIRQFLDVGTGLPTADNTHEVAQRLVPDSRIVYVDNDPLILTFARALLTSTPSGKTDYIHADLREPEKILQEAAETLDFNQPIALMFMGVLGLVDYAQARAIVTRMMEALPSGSYLALNDGINTNAAAVEAMRQYNESGADTYHLRSPEQIAAFFEGLELVEPGLVSFPRWRPDASTLNTPALDESSLCGVGRKP